jgi:hypothetical protein
VAFVKIKGVEPFLLTHPGFYFFISITLKEHSLVFKAAANVQPFFFTSKTFFEVFFRGIFLEEQPLFLNCGVQIYTLFCSCQKDF